MNGTDAVENWLNTRTKFYIDLAKYLSIKPRKIPQGKKYYVSNFKMEEEE